MASEQRAALAQVGGANLERFVVQSALLSMIDPVRGEPTRTPLDENPDIEISGGQQLKQKFLDSFALICSTSSSGAETASAVCLGEQVPSGTILRVARNYGLTTRDLSGLEGVLQILQSVALKDAERTSAQAEPEILRLVVDLDKGRILSLAKRAENRGIRKFLLEARSRLGAGQEKSMTRAKPELSSWLESCPFTAAAPVQAWSPTTTSMLIDWSSRARWSYAEQMNSLFGLEDRQIPPWLNSLHKIARYRSAIKSMVKLAAKQPEVFVGICIRGVNAPNPRLFSLSKERAHLFTAIESLVKEDSEATMDKLERHLGTPDVEAQLRRACRLNLTLHAEMQLVVFYEGNPTSIPRLPFIGTSKKACFLCHEYLLQHPLRLQVSACHQKLYPSWMPPPYYPTSGRKKSPSFAKLSRKMEQLTRRELKTALTAPRRPRNQDSTAGPSLTVTATVPTGLGEV